MAHPVLLFILGQGVDITSHRGMQELELLDGFLRIIGLNLFVADPVVHDKIKRNPRIIERNGRRLNLDVFATDKQILRVLIEVVIKVTETTIRFPNLHVVTRNTLHRIDIFMNLCQRLVEEFDTTYILFVGNLLNEEVLRRLHLDVVILHLHGIIAIIVERLATIDVLGRVAWHVSAEDAIETILSHIATSDKASSDEGILFSSPCFHTMKLEKLHQ